MQLNYLIGAGEGYFIIHLNTKIITNIYSNQNKKQPWAAVRLELLGREDPTSTM